MVEVRLDARSALIHLRRNAPEPQELRRSLGTASEKAQQNLRKRLEKATEKGTFSAGKPKTAAELFTRLELDDLELLCAGDGKDPQPPVDKSGRIR